MSAFVKLQRKGQMVIPRSLRQEAGVVEGSLLKVDVIKSGQFLVTAQVTIDRPLITHAQSDRKQILRELAAAVDQLRQDAKDKGIDRMSMAEINRAVAAARRDLRKRGSRPAK
jgi:bifunctional DNA-binding transcriptional regulator/antitoxin component of YhaV-PrlF toxin-antitoxin module